MRWTTAASYLVLVAALVVAGGCKRPASTSSAEPEPTSADKPKGEVAMSLTIQSPAFGQNETIPKRFTGDGEDVSPRLTWSGVPEAAKELALICDDPDAPRPEPWVHWVICKIPASATGLPENVAKTNKPAEPAGAAQGKNSSGRVGYGGPAPPRGHGVHHYRFRLYALDTTLNVRPGIDKDQLLAAMKGHVIAQGELVGTYQR
jgi:Raf kinase inhibitor-like YbhB/YbcL family protein